MVVRNVKIKEAFEVAKVAEDSAPLIRPSVLGTYEYLARCFNNTFFVYEDEKDKEILGYIVGFPNTAKKGEFWLYQVAVLQSYRGKNIGSVLFERFIDQVTSEGYERIRSHYFYENHHSANLHIKYSFKKCGEDERGPFMEKILKE